MTAVFIQKHYYKETSSLNDPSEYIIYFILRLNKRIRFDRKKQHLRFPRSWILQYCES